MACGGCTSTITNILTNLEGVKNFNVDLENKKVTVETDLPQQQVFDAIVSSGRATVFKGEI
jgi:copper chaperone CopZ